MKKSKALVFIKEAQKGIFIGLILYSAIQYFNLF